MLSEENLIGAWRLVDHYYLEDDGSRCEGPLGSRADGLLIYQEGGYMAASMMRTQPVTGDGASPPPTYLGSSDDYLGYSGTWHVRDDTVIHEVTIGSQQRVVNTRQVREARLDDVGGLRLQRHLGEPHTYVIMEWQRA